MELDKVTKILIFVIIIEILIIIGLFYLKNNDILISIDSNGLAMITYIDDSIIKDDKGNVIGRAVNMTVKTINHTQIRHQVGNHSYYCDCWDYDNPSKIEYMQVIA